MPHLLRTEFSARQEMSACHRATRIDIDDDGNMHPGPPAGARLGGCPRAPTPQIRTLGHEA